MAEPSDRKGPAVINSAVQCNRSHSGGNRPGQLGSSTRRPHTVGGSLNSGVLR